MVETILSAVDEYQSAASGTDISYKMSTKAQERRDARASTESATSTSGTPPRDATLGSLSSMRNGHPS